MKIQDEAGNVHELVLRHDEATGVWRWYIRRGQDEAETAVSGDTQETATDAALEAWRDNPAALGLMPGDVYIGP